MIMPVFELKRALRLAVAGLLAVSFLSLGSYAQETPPAPAAPKAITVPAVRNSSLPNGLSLAVVERRAVPIVTVELLVKSGASAEDNSKAGLANMTASLLTKGTKTRNATEVAEAMEFLGGSINTGAGWNNSVVIVTVTPDKLDQAMGIMADVVLNPAFKQEELDLLKSQNLDGLTFNLKQPGFLASYAASKYSFNEHPPGGTPDSLNSITRSDIESFHKQVFRPDNSILIFTGDISDAMARQLAAKYYGTWKAAPQMANTGIGTVKASSGEPNSGARRILVIDLPNSGQASVSYLRRTPIGRVKAEGAASHTDAQYYPANVLNSVLGGGYSSRLNQEIRIKRGLSYGAGSSFGWRYAGANFSTRTQTKNESAAEVAELVLAELKRLTSSSVSSDELVPRKSVLTGTFGRNLETTAGLAAAIADLSSFGLSASELNTYMTNVNAVSDAQIKEFAVNNLMGGDLIIVGDYSVFKDDLTKRFPNMPIDVIKADDLDLNKENMRK